MLDIYSYPSESAKKKLKRIVQRAAGFQPKDLKAVQRILDDVRRNGDQALIDYTRRFDAPDLQIDHLRVSESEIAAAARQVDRRFKKALQRAADQIAAFHSRQKQASWIDSPRPGTLLGQIVHPVDAAGIYVPGGKGGETPLVSSVLMGAVPASIAGVPRIVMTSPPTAKGEINPHLLAAARVSGVHEIYKVGSAWAIAALAYGTAAIAKVDVIVGPGNIFVTMAKKLVSGSVRIDMIAGPSEILVVADSSAHADHIAADMLSQAEHDALASAVLVTDSIDLARAVQSELSDQLQRLRRRDIAARALESYGAILVVPDLDTALDLANAIAPEHLELQVREPLDHVGRIRHAGAIFIGPHTPEPVGDYMAGPNHVLPTAGTARFSSALSVEHFVKKTSLIHYSAEAFAREADDIIRLAETEGLDAHASAVKVRLKKDRHV